VPLRIEAPLGAPCWVDVYSSDTDKAQAFYGELFGWTAESAGEEFGGYINFAKDGQPVAGCMKNDGSTPAPDAWTVHLAVKDAQATIDVAVANGGQLHVPPMEVMDLGTMALVGDAGGAAVGIWQPGSFQGFGVLAEPGSPAWFELFTRDYDRSVEFYRTVFDWDIHVTGDTPEFRYSTLGEGDGQQAGIMDASAFLPEGVPAHWSVYFATEDTDASLAKLVELGGNVVVPAEDTPYGRLASASDPTGAMFKLVQTT